MRIVKVNSDKFVFKTPQNSSIFRIFVSMSTKEKELIESLVAGGLIGSTLGFLLSKEKSAGTLVGAIAGAALFASYRANEQAKKTEVSLVVEEDNVIYQIQKDGTRKILKTIPKSEKTLPKRFILK